MLPFSRRELAILHRDARRAEILLFRLWRWRQRGRIRHAPPWRAISGGAAVSGGIRRHCHRGASTGTQAQARRGDRSPRMCPAEITADTAHSRMDRDARRRRVAVPGQHRDAVVVCLPRRARAREEGRHSGHMARRKVEAGRTARAAPAVRHGTAGHARPGPGGRGRENRRRRPASVARSPCRELARWLQGCREGRLVGAGRAQADAMAGCRRARGRRHADHRTAARWRVPHGDRVTGLARGLGSGRRRGRGLDDAGGRGLHEAAQRACWRSGAS